MLAGPSVQLGASAAQVPLHGPGEPLGQGFTRLAGKEQFTAAESCQNPRSTDPVVTCPLKAGGRMTRKTDG